MWLVGYSVGKVISQSNLSRQERHSKFGTFYTLIFQTPIDELLPQLGMSSSSRSRWKLAEQTVIRVRTNLLQHTKLNHTTLMTQRQETLIGAKLGHRIHLELNKLKVTFSSWPHTGEQYSRIGRTNEKNQRSNTEVSTHILYVSP